MPADRVGKTHALLKEAFDDSRVHLFVLVHLGHFGSNDLVRELLDCARDLSSVRCERRGRSHDLENARIATAAMAD